MVFHQIEFLFLFPLLLISLFLLKKNTTKKNLLLVFSYYFYAYWDWRFLSLIFISTAVNYFIGQKLMRLEVQGQRRFYMILGVGFNLCLLGFFKYYNFFTESFNELFKNVGLEFQSINILLPVGISFYTFQALSYVIDLYKKQIRQCSQFTDFALYISFFPQLVAGPIVRASEFLPQLEENREITKIRLFEGLKQFTFGLFKKVFIADRLSFFVDNVFTNYSVFDSVTIWLAVICYAIQLYCDFSGYSDMAIGIARSMGYDFNVNFNLPYIATNISDFWRRWHISLSTWLRDYLYIPLGGSKKGYVRTILNLMITMLLGGLWHGAAWNFIIWGLWHGLALVIYRVYKGFKSKNQHKSSSLRAIASWGLTILVVLIGWVFFRSQTLSQAFVIINKMFVFESGVSWMYGFALLAILLLVIQHLMNLRAFSRSILSLPYDSIKTPIVLFTMLWLVVIFYPKDFSPFIYFQF